MTSRSLIRDLARVVGQQNVLEGTKDGVEAVVRPGSTQDVAGCLHLIADAGRTVVTVGGGSGLVGGAEGDVGQIALSTSRLNSIRPILPQQRTVAAGAGALLSRVQSAANAVERRFGVDLGARDSCTIGGMVATNAGGIRVMRYGMMRRNVAGLQVVLADGTIIDDMSGLEKNNTGIDLSQVHIGAEGTLGVVTAAMLRLVPQPRDSATALLGFKSSAVALAAAQAIETRALGQLSSAEIMWADYLAAAVRATGAAHPLPGWAVYLLAQVETDGPDRAEDMLMTALADISEQGDGVIAATNAQESLLWALREASDLVERQHRHTMSFDVSLRPMAHESYLTDVIRGLEDFDPTLVSYSFGHLLDGNIHLIIASDGDQKPDAKKLSACVYDPLAQHGSTSISAEHGIGREKAPHLWRSRSALEISAMNRIRDALDPCRLLNPHIRFHHSDPIQTANNSHITEAVHG
jgi:FAD/FMN-containing dehydrogenase